MEFQISVQSVYFFDKIILLCGQIFFVSQSFCQRAVGLRDIGFMVAIALIPFRACVVVATNQLAIRTFVQGFLEREELGLKALPFLYDFFVKRCEYLLLLIF